MFPGHFLIHDLSPVCNQITTTGAATTTILPEHPSSAPQFFRGSCYSILVLCFLCFVDGCLSFCTCCFGHFVVCSSIYRFCLPFGIFKLFSQFKSQSVIEMTSGTMRLCHCIVCHPSIVLSIIAPLYCLSSFHCIICHPSICDFRLRFWYVHVFLRKAHSYDKIILNIEAHQHN